MKEKKEKDVKEKENITKNAEETAEAQTEEAQTEEAKRSQETAKEDDKSEALKAELEEQKAQLLRLAAEYDNFKKRTQREKDEIFTNSKVFVIKELLPIIDNFERAAQNGNQSFDDYKKGVDMIFAQFKDAIQKLNVEAFGEVGDEFDPMLHNAVMHKEDDSLPENVISNVFQKGYKIGDIIVRHAMVETAN